MRTVTVSLPVFLENLLDRPGQYRYVGLSFGGDNYRYSSRVEIIRSLDHVWSTFREETL